MAAKTTLNAKNLEALGTRRLAELLMEIGARDASVGDLLRLELAGTKSPARAAREIRNQMTAMRGSRSFHDRNESPALAGELDTLRWAIVERVAHADAAEGLDLMWDFMELADSVFEYCDDSGGSVGAVFRAAREDLGEIAHAAKPDPALLAGRTFGAITNNGYGQYDGLIGILQPALGQVGLECLKQRVTEFSGTSATQPADKDSPGKVFGLSGSISEDEWRERRWLSIASIALRDIADAQDDVDGYIAQYDKDTRKFPRIAAQIARRLLSAGRAEQALHMLDAAVREDAADWRWCDCEWEDVRIRVLEALERNDQAQQVRLGCFERFLSIPHLRAYLERLADDQSVKAQEKAFDYAQEFQHRLAALDFFVSWPALDRASRLVVEHANSLDGDRYETLAPTAIALMPDYPLAATLVLRAQIDHTLGRGKSTRYRYAVRDLSKCSSLSRNIGDFQSYESHDAYVRRLRRDHGRKRSFWAMIN